MGIYEVAEASAMLLVQNLARLEGNPHPDRNYGAFALGHFRTDRPSEIIIKTTNIGTNPHPDKEAKYGFLALEKLIGNFSYWQRHQERRALSRFPTVDENLWRFLGSALTVTHDGRGVVSAFSGHPEGLVDEAIAGVVNYSLGLASEDQLEGIAGMSGNRYISSMLSLYKELRAP